MKYPIAILATFVLFVVPGLVPGPKNGDTKTGAGDRAVFNYTLATRPCTMEEKLYRPD